MAEAAPPPVAAPAADAPEDDSEGFGDSDVLMDSVTKDEWKTIEASLSHNKKIVAEMLKRACAQVRTKGDSIVDESNGKFLGDMLAEMDTFAVWCYKEHIRPKIMALLPDGFELDEGGEDDDKKKKKGKDGGGGGKTPRGGGGGGNKGKGGGKGKDAINAKTQIKIDNVMRIMEGSAAKERKGSAGVGDKAIGWLEALEPGKNLVVDAPWELQLAKEMGTAAGLLGKKESGVSKKESEEARYRNVRNLADAIVIFETQYKVRYQTSAPADLQLLADARIVLDKLKAKTKFTVSKCLRKHPHLLSSSQFKARHAAKFLQPYGTQLELFKSIATPGPRLVLLRSPPDTGKTSLAPSLPELFPEHRIVFCCLARRVNLEVAQTLYNMGIPFAWCHNRQVTCSWLCGLRGASTSTSVAQMEEKLRLGVEKIQETTGGMASGRVRKRHVQVIRPPRMFVTDVASCAWLTQQLDPSKSVLMIDEPTMGADQGNGDALPPNSLTGLMTQAMLAAPFKTIWSSATLPPKSALPTFTNAFVAKFAPQDESVVDELVSMQLNVGVLLVRPNGQVALPHSMCYVEQADGAGAAAALEEFVQRLKQEPLLLKAYTAQAIVSMEDRLTADDVKPLLEKSSMDVPNIDEHFQDLSKLSHSSLRQYATLILEKLAATKDDKLISLACKPTTTAADAAFPPFDASKLLLQNAHKFPGMTLTVSSDPKQQIASTAEALIKEMPSLKKLNKEMEAGEAALQKRLDGIRKEAEKVKGGEDRIEEIISAKLREYGISDSAGTLKIPENCVVNSRQHIMKYAGKEVAEEFDGSFIRNPPSSAEFKKVATLPVDETWSALLLSGVAAHMPHDHSLNPAGDTSYTNYVADQMENGKLAVCGVTKDFTYGANVPCTSVLVDRDFLHKHSANTLRQFIGRVARTGLANLGVAQFEDDDFLPKMCGKNDNQEALCMEATAQGVVRLVAEGGEIGSL